MPRLMSVAYTAPAVRDRSKTVTRRKGWTFLKPGDRLTLCPKVQGRVRATHEGGERHVVVDPLERICDVEVVSVSRERLDRLFLDLDYGRAEVALEGFPGMQPGVFVRQFFVDAQAMRTSDEVTRIEWRYLACVRCGRDPIQNARHAPCCSSHGKQLCCGCYSLTHFVETGCCGPQFSRKALLGTTP